MPRNANHTERVAKSLRPGQYINRKGDFDYVYDAHSKRGPDGWHPVRVCDGYLERITEQDAMQEVHSDPFILKEGFPFRNMQ